MQDKDMSIEKKDNESSGKDLPGSDFSRDISILIDTYEDIFSDFDPRNFSERDISDDFLNETKKVSRENDFHINRLRLLIPDGARNKEAEAVIAKRLHAHFRKNHTYFEGVKKNETRRAVLFIIAGTLMMVAASYVSFQKSTNFIMHVLLVLLEPAGWFLVWGGLDGLVNLSRRQKTDLRFYTKMVKVRIEFINK